MTSYPIPNDLQQVFDYIDTQQEKHLQRLIEYLKMPSISAQGIGMQEVADFLVDELARLGFQAELKPSAGYPFVYAQREPRPGLLNVMIYGHYDVQPLDPLDEWVAPPFEPDIRDGRLYARGVGDNKGQHFANMLGIEALLAVLGELPCNVSVLLEGEEEVGSPHIAAFMENNKDWLKPDLVIISDGPVDESGQSRIEFGVRGVLIFELHARGANQDVHSGNWGGVVPNPIWTLTHLLASMKNEKGEITIDGFYDGILPPSELEQQALDKLTIDEDEVKARLALTDFDQPLDRPFYDRLGRWPTLTINGLHGGYAGPGPKTIIPAAAFAKCDIRLIEAQSVKEVFAKVEAHVQKHAPEVEVKFLGGMDPSRTPMESEFTNPILAAVCAAQQAEPLMLPALGGSLPNYVFTKILDTPTFLIPYANADQNNHGPNENMEVYRFYQGIKTGAAMLYFLGQSAKNLI